MQVEHLPKAKRMDFAEKEVTQQSRSMSKRDLKLKLFCVGPKVQVLIPCLDQLLDTASQEGVLGQGL